MLVLICFLMNNAAMNFSCFYNETKNESYICSTEVNCHISMIHSKLPVYVCMYAVNLRLPSSYPKLFGMCVFANWDIGMLFWNFSLLKHLSSL